MCDYFLNKTVLKTFTLNWIPLQFLLLQNLLLIHLSLLLSLLSSTFLSFFLSFWRRYFFCQNTCLQHICEFSSRSNLWIVTYHPSAALSDKALTMWLLPVLPEQSYSCVDMCSWEGCSLSNQWRCQQCPWLEGLHKLLDTLSVWECFSIDLSVYCVRCRQRRLSGPDKSPCMGLR